MTTPSSIASEAAQRIDAMAVRSTVATRPTIPGRALRVTPFRDMKVRTAGRYLIKKVIPGSSFVLVYGVSGSGKTFFIGYAALCIATGREFLGFKVTPGLVVYVAPENPQSVEHRFVANAAELGIEDAQLVMVAGNLDMITEATFHHLMKTLRAIADEQGPIAAVVVDTVSQAMPGADENGSDGMTAFVAACQRIRHEFDCSVVAVHHSGKNVDLGARGHSSLRAAVDVEIRVTGAEGTRTAELTKVRDGGIGLQIPFNLRVIPLGDGFDEDGDPVTTCIVESALADAQPRGPQRKPKGAIQILVWEALLRLTDSAGRRVPHLPATSPLRGVDLEQLRDEAYRTMQQIDPKHRSTRFGSAVSSLSADGLINTRDEWVWLTRPGVTPDHPVSKDTEGVSGSLKHPNTPDSGDRVSSGNRVKS